MQNGTTERDAPGLDSIHHQFTLLIKVILTKKVKMDWTFSGKHRRSSSFSTGQQNLKRETTTSPRGTIRFCFRAADCEVKSEVEPCETSPILDQFVRNILEL